MLRKTVLSAMLAACIVALPACITCDPGWDTPTCDVNQAIAIGGKVDLALQAMMLAVPTLPPAVVAVIVAYHKAYPLAVTAAQTALATYEATHAGDWRAALNFLTALYTNVTDLLAAAGHPGILAQAKADVKAEGASQVIHELHMKGVLK
jgi:hypothetical protein